MKSTIAAIHVAKKQLGLDEDTYRAKLEVITGKTSVKNMTEAEREKVLNVFETEGFTPKAGRRPDGRLKLSGRFAGKLQALWIAGWNLGIFDNRDDAALEAFVKRQNRSGCRAVLPRCGRRTQGDRGAQGNSCPRGWRGLDRQQPRTRLHSDGWISGRKGTMEKAWGCPGRLLASRDGPY